MHMIDRNSPCWCGSGRKYKVCHAGFDAKIESYREQGYIVPPHHIIKAGTTSPYSLYSETLASFTTGDQYDHHDAEGFITLFGLPLKVRAMRMQELEKNHNK